MRKLLALLAVAGVATLGTAACSDGDESSDTTARSSSEDASEGSGDSDGFSVETPEGQVSISLDGELPPNWPEDFPAPKSSDVAGSGSLAGSSSGVLVGVYTTRESAEDAFDAYTGDDELNASEVKKVDPGDTFLGTMTISGTYDGSITVTSVGGTTYVVVVLSTDGGGSDTTDSTTTTTS